MLLICSPITKVNKGRASFLKIQSHENSQSTKSMGPKIWATKPLKMIHTITSSKRFSTLSGALLLLRKKTKES